MSYRPRTVSWMLPSLLSLCFAVVPGSLSAQSTPEYMPNRLSAEEKRAGWVLLFDGKSTKGWRGFRQRTAPRGWVVEHGVLVRESGGGDLITERAYRNFELALEWKISDGGNSGIMYRVTEEGKESYETGPEMQVLDDAKHADGKNRLTSAGSAYGLYAAPEGVVHPAGQWNTVKIVVNGHHVEHWLNGVKVVTYELESPEWEARVADSKFSQWKGYGLAPSGYIALQDHGDHVEYRSIRIHELP